MEAPTWRIFETASAGDRLILGLERFSRRRRRLRLETRVEERILTREFHEREIVEIATYRGQLEEVATCLAQGTFGSSVDVRALREGVRVELVHRRLGSGGVEAEITGERDFRPDETAEAAGY